MKMYKRSFLVQFFEEEFFVTKKAALNRAALHFTK